MSNPNEKELGKMLELEKQQISLEKEVIEHTKLLQQIVQQNANLQEEIIEMNKKIENIGRSQIKIPCDPSDVKLYKSWRIVVFGLLLAIGLVWFVVYKYKNLETQNKKNQESYNKLFQKILAIQPLLDNTFRSHKGSVYFYDNTIQLSKLEFEGIQEAVIDVNNVIYELTQEDIDNLVFYVEETNSISTHGFKFSSETNYVINNPYISSNVYLVSNGSLDKEPYTWYIENKIPGGYLELEQFSLYGKTAFLNTNEDFANWLENQECIASVHIIKIKCKKFTFHSIKELPVKEIFLIQ